MNGQLGAELEETVQVLAGGDLDVGALQQVRLPGALGGMGMGMRQPASIADAAFWATWGALKDKVVYLCRAMGRPVQHETDARQRHVGTQTNIHAQRNATNS